MRNAKTYRDIFGDRFYIEIMRHGMPEQDTINEGLVRVARELTIPLVATNDSHYLEQKDAPAHDVLLCIGTGKTVPDKNRMKFYSDQFYVKSPEEMRALLGDVPEACDNTLKIVERIDIRIPEKIFHLPLFPVAARRGRAPNAAMRSTCASFAMGGLIERYGAERAPRDAALRERLGLRTRRDHVDGLRLVLPDRLGLHQVRARPRHPGRPGPRLGGRFAGLVLFADHRSRSAAVQPDLRALPQPRPNLDARYRHRFLRRPARRSDPLRHR